MKYRIDFVTNSSSSSYICDICGRTETEYDLDLEEAEMIMCVNGHTICDEEMLMLDRGYMIDAILDYEEENANWIENFHTREDLSKSSNEKIMYAYMEAEDARWDMPEECCPICQFLSYSQEDMKKFLLLKYGISIDQVLMEIKKKNPRRRKVYDREYIAYVCDLYDLKPNEIMANWKNEFGSYNNFKKMLKYN